MIEIKNFFDKFLKLDKNNSDTKFLVADTIYKITCIKISENQIEIKENSIYIKSKPIYKGEILMNMEKIMDSLKKSGINKNLN